MAVLEPLGVDMIAANCSTGPEGCSRSPNDPYGRDQVPVMVMPNAGMPELVGD